MFCTYCGKEIINSARFCNYCGNPVHNIAPISTPTTEQSYSAPVPETNKARYETADSSIPDGGVDIFAQSAAETSSDAVSEFSETGTAETETSVFETSQINDAQQTSAADTFSTTNHAYPMPNVIPHSGFGVSGSYSAPASGAESTPAAPSKPERERKYTLGHIMLCLAATAVMAITAGVFAGLYFSVV